MYLDTFPTLLTSVRMSSDDSLPPVLPSLSDRLDSFLLHPERLPIHDGASLGLFRPAQLNPRNLLRTAAPAPLETCLRVDRDLATGRILGFREVRLQEAGSTARWVRISRFM